MERGHVIEVRHSAGPDVDAVEPGGQLFLQLPRELREPVDRGDHLGRRHGRHRIPLAPQDRLKRSAAPPPVRHHRMAGRVRRGERQQRAGGRLRLGVLGLSGLLGLLGRLGRSGCRAVPCCGQARPCCVGLPGQPPGRRGAADDLVPGLPRRLCRPPGWCGRTRSRWSGRVERSGAERRVPDPGAPDATASAWCVVPRQRRRHSLAVETVGAVAARGSVRQPGRRLQRSRCLGTWRCVRGHAAICLASASTVPADGFRARPGVSRPAVSGAQATLVTMAPLVTLSPFVALAMLIALRIGTPVDEPAKQLE